MPYHPVSHAMAFPQPPAGLASVALVPLLRNRRLIGSLNLGSRDPSRFTPLLGTDFVEHMGSIIAICLENVISNEMLKYIGLTDALTGVYNRRYMDRRLAEEIARARRQAYRLSCMYIDIDHFKQVNDTTATRPATTCCAKWRRASRPSCACRTRWAASAARNSWCC
jgi:two-component system cell cycle response regulator